MTTTWSWQDLYRAALLEVDIEELRRRVDAAKQAVHQRIAELKPNDESSCEEREALADALRLLRVLAETECKLRVSTEVGSPQSEVAS